jgi:hypothetical protein
MGKAGVKAKRGSTLAISKNALMEHGQDKHPRGPLSGSPQLRLALDSG